MRVSQIIPGLNWMKKYQPEWLSGDITAGLTVGVMLIPQGMAYAMIAGLPPIYGLYASIVPLLVYALFGTSRQLGVGPVALVALLVASGVAALDPGSAQEYIEMAIVLALMVGTIQLLIGVLRLGFLVNFLSHPVISGFTSAAALIIGFSQIKHLIGVDLPGSKHLHELVASLLSELHNSHLLTLAIGIGGIVLIMTARRVNRKIPGSLIAVSFGILITYFFTLSSQGVAIVGSIPAGLPTPSVPRFSLALVMDLLPMALTIALISFMESWAVAKAIQSKHKNYEIEPNKELVALGLANVAGSMFRSFPTTGGFSRSAVNDQAGANTGLASVISAGLIILTLLFLTPLFFFLPNAILASVILVAVIGLVDIKEARFLWKTDRRDFAMLMATFLVTAFGGLEIGIGTGVVLSILLLVYRSTQPHIAVLGEIGNTGIFRNINRFNKAVEPPGILIIRTDTQWYYANINYLQQRIGKLLEARKEVHTLLIDASGIHDIDSSAIHFLKDLYIDLDQRLISLKFVRMIGPVRDRFAKAGLFEMIGESNFHTSIEEVVTAEREKLNSELPLQTNTA